MILTRKQEEGLKVAVQRYKDGEPYTVISGFAGSGKTTLVHFIIAALDIDPDYITYIAYTGKAAQVLRNNGCPNAMTAHKLLYRSVPKKDGTFVHIPHSDIEPYKLVVVDEVSMLPKQMWELLLSHHVYVLALGDPGQLPPVRAEAHDVLEHPHVFLDEIMRQAQESEIIRLTMDIRAGKLLEKHSGQEVRVVGREELLKEGFLAWADQILVGKNSTRHQMNCQLRKIWMNTEDPEPLIGDKVICLRNDWKFLDIMGIDALVNGLDGYITALRRNNDNPFTQHRNETLYFNIQPCYDGSIPFDDIEVDYSLLTRQEPLVTRENWRRIPMQFHPHEFDYGYAITTHKAQGSEYDKVIVLEEWMKNDTRDSHIKWLYTAATRARKKLIIVRNYH